MLKVWHLVLVLGVKTLYLNDYFIHQPLLTTFYYKIGYSLKGYKSKFVWIILKNLVLSANEAQDFSITDIICYSF